VIQLTVPFPPSANRYWRNVNGRMVISREARHYRKQVGLIIKTTVSPDNRPISKPMRVDIIANRPDRRRRDIDNLLKATLDALEIAGLYVNDSLIHQLSIKWGSVQNIANLEVQVTVL